MEPKNNKRLLDLRGSKTVLVWVYIIRFSHKGEIKEKPHNVCVSGACNIYKDFLPNVVHNRGRCVRWMCVFYVWHWQACTVLYQDTYVLLYFSYIIQRIHSQYHMQSAHLSIIHIHPHTCDSSTIFYTIRCDQRNLQGVENKLVYHPLLESTARSNLYALSLVLIINLSHTIAKILTY